MSFGRGGRYFFVRETGAGDALRASRTCGSMSLRMKWTRGSAALRCRFADARPSGGSSLGETIGPMEQCLPPRALVKIPVDGARNAFVRMVQRVPIQLALGEARINRVTPVVPETVGDERNQALGLAQPVENQFHNLEVRHFPVPAKI